MNLSGDWLMQAGLRGTLLMGGLFLLWKFVPAARPALRRHLLLGTAAALLVAPWLSGWWAITSPPAAAVSSQTSDHPFSVSWPSVLASLWLIGSGWAIARLTFEAWSLHRLIRRARPWPGPPALPSLTVLQSSAISGPCVARGHRPVLLLPDSARDWTPSQWEMVLAHETQHLSQQDLRLAWLPRLVHCLYWWHPLAHWLTRQFHAESEVLCDRAVLARSGHGPREYIEFLLSLNADRFPAHAAGMALTSPLGKRIERILLTHRKPRSRWAAAATLFILAGIAMVSFSVQTVPPAPPHRLPMESAVPAEIPMTGPDTEVDLRLSANPFPEE